MLAAGSLCFIQSDLCQAPRRSLLLLPFGLLQFVGHLCAEQVQNALVEYWSYILGVVKCAVKHSLCELGLMSEVHVHALSETFPAKSRIRVEILHGLKNELDLGRRQHRMLGTVCGVGF